MEFPVIYFTMDDGTRLRATFRISGYTFVRIDISERTASWFSTRWDVKTDPMFGDAKRLHDFIRLTKEDVRFWAEREAKAWHEYSKVLKAYKP